MKPEYEADDHLWKIASRRVFFRRHLYLYLMINTFLWLVWLMTNLAHSKSQPWEFPWPIYPMMGWGLGLAWHYGIAYLGLGAEDIQHEYDKLKKQKKL